MTRFPLVLCSAILIANSPSFAQGVAPQKGNAPVAFVYVATANDSQNQVDVLAATDDGRLTLVSEGPTDSGLKSMTANSSFLFGTDDLNIYSFSIAPDGGLTWASAINAQKFNDDNCGGPVAVFLDRSSTTLYDADFYGNICANGTYQYFNFDQVGDLSYFGVSDASVDFDVPLSFTGNNLFAYGATSLMMAPGIFGFERNDDGTLSVLPINPPMPDSKSGEFYMPTFTSTDGANHLATSVQAWDSDTWQPIGVPQLAIYSADNEGKLSTKSTYLNMPATMVGYVTDLKISPSGDLLAVGGSTGLQVFQLNGANPMRPITRLLTRAFIDQIAWDNAGHLYAISSDLGKLFVFSESFASPGLKAAPGSPYSIVKPLSLAVVSK